MQALWEEKLEASEAAEVHWSTGTILATFFAASLISAVFFGLGYSFGRGGTAKPTVGMTSSLTDASATEMHHSASSSAAVPDKSQHRSTGAMVVAAAHPSRETKPIHAASEQASKMQATHAVAVPARANKSAATATHPKTSAAETTGTAHYMVQVGAVGDRKDARTLVSQLRKRGFHAEVYPGKHDKYLHVQIGPFANVEQAQTMRQRVVADGYHAILKHSS